MVTPLSQPAQPNINISTGSYLQTLGDAPLKKTEEEVVTQAMKPWITHSERLTPNSRELFSGYIRGMATMILLRIKHMRAIGETDLEINRQMIEAVSWLNSSADLFLRNRAIYEIKKQEGSAKLNQMNTKIKNATVDFSSFGPPSTNESKTDEYNPRDAVVSFANERIGSVLQYTLGKPVAVGYDLATNTLSADIDPESQSPWRDRIISVAVDVGILETISTVSSPLTATLAMPTMLTTSVAVSSVHLVAFGARQLEPVMDRLDPITENHVPRIDYGHGFAKIAAGGDLTYEESVALVRGCIKMAQYPSRFLNAVHDKFSTAMTNLSNKNGLTDENIKHAFIRSVELLAKCNPNLLTDETWVTIDQEPQH
jgi:hypothetical protein